MLTIPTDLTVPVARTGGTEKNSFPHVCPYQEKGASKEFCKQQTAMFIRNRDGCLRTKCNCELRKCIMCLSLMRQGTDVKYVDDPKVGLCKEHAEEVNNPRPRPAPAPKPLVRPMAKPLQPPVEPATVAATAESPPEPAPVDDVLAAGRSSQLAPEEKPEAAPTVRTPSRPRKPRKPLDLSQPLDAAEIALAARGVEAAGKLNQRRRSMLFHCGLALNNSEIGKAIGTTTGTVGVEFAGIYATLGLHDLETGQKRRVAAAIAREVFKSDPRYRT